MRSRGPRRSARETVELMKCRRASQHPEKDGKRKGQHGHAHPRHTRFHAGRTGSDPSAHRHDRTRNLVNGCRHQIMTRTDRGIARLMQHHRVRGRIHLPAVAVQAMHRNNPGQKDEQADKPQRAPRGSPRPIQSAHRVPV